MTAPDHGSWRESSQDVVAVRTFDVPREQVFRNWIDPDLVGPWFAPDGYAVTLCELDARPGGAWRVQYRSAAGEAYEERGEFREIVVPERLEFTLIRTDSSGRSGPRMLVRVTFDDLGSQTRMTFRQSGFESTAQRDDELQGWSECFNKLERQLGR